MRALLLPGDLYVLSGQMRWKWTHAVPYASVDHFKGRSYERSDGFSVTWRPHSWKRDEETQS